MGAADSMAARGLSTRAPKTCTACRLDNVLSHPDEVKDIAALILTSPEVKAADVAEPVAALVLGQLTDEFGAVSCAGGQTRRAWVLS